MTRRHLIIIWSAYLIICLFYFFWTVRSTQPGYPLDDSWIHQVFARNLANGDGFSFNPGEPISAATAPLWPLVLVPFWLLLGPVASGLIVGAFLQGLVYKLVRQITDDTRLALFSVILSTLLWPVIWGAMSGMETGLFSALSLWGLYFFFRSEKPNDKFRNLAYLLFTLSFLSRPECALFVTAAMVHDFIISIISRDKSIKPWITRILIVLAVTSPYFIFNYFTAGSFFPRTFSAKVMERDLISAILRLDLKGTLHALTVYPYFYLQHFYRKVININPVMTLALIPGVIKLVGIQGPDRSKRIMLVILFLLYVPLMGVFSPVFSATWQNYRYITNLLPIMMVIGVIGLFWKNEVKSERSKKPFLITGSILTAAGIFLVFFFEFFNRNIIPLLVQNPALLASADFRYLTEVIGRVGKGTLIMGAMVFAGYAFSFLKVRRFIGSGIVGMVIVAVIIIFCGIVTVYKAQYYSDNVRNINECDVASGKLLAELARPDDVVAVNDIGAIGYYSNMEIFDLWGLISTEVTVQMLNNDYLTFEHMRQYKQVDYMVIAPAWFTYLSKRTDIFHPIAELVTENNTILAQDRNIVYRAFWPDSTTENYQEPR
jgi:hypothetical protein